jgi:phosphoribosylaminoimidazole carboxylase (NCAIR synthetase)
VAASSAACWVWLDLPLAIEPVFWEPEASACAQLIGEHLCAPYEDAKGVGIALLSDVDVCTYEFENVPSPVLTALAARCRCIRRWLRWK